MTAETFLMVHGSALILPLSVIEGPVVAALTGFLAARGYCHPALAIALLLAGDLLGDLGYYCVGRGGAGRLAWLSARLGVAHRITPEMQHGLRQNATRMLLIGKWTHSVGFAVLVGCGVMRMALPRFLLINFFAAVPKICVLFALGYFAGGHYRFAEKHAFLASAVLAAVGVGAILLVLRRMKTGLAGDAGR